MTLRVPLRSVRMASRRCGLLTSVLVVAALVMALAPTVAVATSAPPQSTSPAAPSSTSPVANPTGDDASIPAGVPFTTVPKAYVLTVGGAMNYKSGLPNRSVADAAAQATGLNGVEFMGEWLWQLGGFRSNWPVWLGYYLGWLHYPGGDNHRWTGVLEYGVRVRHGYRLTPTVRPFFTYCLGATQVWVSGVPGRGITHQTRTGIGVDIKVARRMRLLIATEWMRQALPDLGSNADRGFAGLTLNVGVVFERPAR